MCAFPVLGDVTASHTSCAIQQGPWLSTIGWPASPQLRLTMLYTCEALLTFGDLAVAIEADVRLFRQRIGRPRDPGGKQWMEQTDEAVDCACDTLLARLQVLRALLAGTVAVLCEIKECDRSDASALMQWQIAHLYTRPAID